MPYVSSIGKPDYSQEISKIAYGETYTDRIARVDEYFKVFKLQMYTGGVGADAPLGVADPVRHLLDMDTGLPAPFTVPAGYASDLIQWNFYLSSGGTTPANALGTGLYIVLDGITYWYLIPRHFSCYFNHSSQKIVWLSSDLTDLNKTSSHTWDFYVESNLINTVWGSVEIALLIRKT